MKHLSVSRSDEYCSLGNTATPSLCGVARSCPELNGFADFSGIFSLTASILPKIPDVFCEAERSPKAFSDAHRKMPTNAERHVGVYRSQAAFWDGLYDTKLVRAVDEFPVDRIRRMIRLAHWMQSGSRTCGSVFF